MEKEWMEYGLSFSRRRFFSKLSLGIGGAALGSLLIPKLFEGNAEAQDDVLAGARLPHFAPKAKRIIYLFQNGAPSQLESFDYKPGLAGMLGKDLPPSVRNGQRLTGFTAGQASLPLVGSFTPFKQYGANGTWVSDLFPYTAQILDDICIVRSMHTEAINHDPAITFFQTGAQQGNRPSMGAWLSYGLGSENQNLPAFTVLISRGRGNSQGVYAKLWSNGFLDSIHQGVQFNSGENPVLYLKDPKGMDPTDRRKMLDKLAALNQVAFEESGDPEINARIRQYEMAYRMQTAVPETLDLSRETDETFELYGPDSRKPGTFAANCILARKLSENGVRFVQLYHQGWDQHANLPWEITGQAKDVDQPAAALVTDLKRRGLLDETLVIWGGEFGRTCFSQGNITKGNYGRDHHPRCFSIWMAGGGIKPGLVYGETDEFSYNVTQNPVHVHDFQATVLHQMGLDHEKLIFKHMGRRFRLTDVAGKVVNDILV
ncbi:DUF1501 domain-containing protein [Ravibacter arvi]|uniref:DUF1501 domain-containing protein n=1 Tax=Ravibacter arvi TaxID=2051041 RepID=A0ABP8LME2_9BACT